MSWTRRSFLGVAAATTVGALATRSFASIQSATSFADDFGGFPIGIQSYSLRNFDLHECVRHIYGLGLHFTEFYSKHLALDASDEQVATTLDLLRQAEISLVAHGVNDFTNDHAANRKVFEFAKRARIKNITANPRPDSFDSLDKLCAEFDVRVCIHNHGPGALYDKISDVVDAVKNRHPNIGACIDTGHFIRSAEDPVKAVHDLAGRVFALHIKDEAEQRPDSHNVIIGTGHLDLVGLFKGLRATKFPSDGTISLEYEAKPENPIEDIRQCIEQAKQAIAKLRPTLAENSQPSAIPNSQSTACQVCETVKSSCPPSTRRRICRPRRSLLPFSRCANNMR